MSPNKVTPTPTPKIEELEIDYCKDSKCKEFQKCQPKNEGFNTFDIV